MFNFTTLTAAARWQGPDDPVTLEDVKSMGVTDVVWDLMRGVVEPHEVISRELISSRIDLIQGAGLRPSVVESLPIHPAVILGLEGAEQYTEVFIQSAENYAAEGVGVITVNFMGYPDWGRSPGEFLRPDGRRALFLDPASFAAIDWFENSAPLPGSTIVLQGDDLRGFCTRAVTLGHEGLWRNVETFLSAIAPRFSAAGLKLAIHPADPGPFVRIDDPQNSTSYKVPRLIASEDDYWRAINVGSKLGNRNPIGACFCVGSLATNPENTNIPASAKKLMDHIHFFHFRDVIRTSVDYGSGPEVGFIEIAHDEIGDGQLREVVHAAVDAKWKGPWRCDHALLESEADIGWRGYPREGRRVSTGIVAGWIEEFSR